MDSTISWPDFRGLGHTARSPQNGPAQRVKPAASAITGQHDGLLSGRRGGRTHSPAATNNIAPRPAAGIEARRAGPTPLGSTATASNSKAKGAEEERGGKEG